MERLPQLSDPYKISQLDEYLYSLTNALERRIVAKFADRVEFELNKDEVDDYTLVILENDYEIGVKLNGDYSVIYSYNGTSGQVWRTGTADPNTLSYLNDVENGSIYVQLD